MRFMVLVKATAESERGKLPTADEMNEMMIYNKQLVEAGVMLDGNGLHASSKGARVQFDAGKAPKVIDGPFAETKELVSGYWLWEAKSLSDALEWLKRAPFKRGETIEVRQMFEMSDFVEGGALTKDEAREQEQKIRELEELGKAQKK